jgi:hypothetical protein
MSYCYQPLVCPPGYFREGSTEAPKCTACAAGWYSDTEDASECIKCSAGTVSSTASSACVSCKNGQTSEAGMSYCYHRTPPLLCGPGYYLEVNTDGDYVCTGCPYNTWSPEGTRHIDACYSCPAGTQYSPQRGCIPCPEGSRGEIREGKAICTMCDPGETTLVAGSTICMKCPKGSFSSGNGKCQYCWPASYSDVPGSATCKPCPFGTSATVVGASKCDSCLP